jgi:hypothetical protein
MLADMGADVIKIEDRVGGDPGRGLVWKSDQSILNTYFECHNRNKRGITLDIRKNKVMVGDLTGKHGVATYHQAKIGTPLGQK